MPRRVVPILVPELEAASSRNPSSSRCSDRISAAFSAIFRLSGDDIHALRLELGDLGNEGMRIEHDAVADDRQLALAHDARWKQRQLVDLAIDDQRMAGIVAALEADDDIGPLRQPVDDLALAFVAPLRADDHHIGHSNFPDCGPHEAKPAN